MNIQRGFRDKLEKYVDINRAITVEMKINGGAVYDYCCFGVDAAEKLSDDRYMIFYNQTRSPYGEITYSPNGAEAEFTVDLSKLPSSINKLVFTASIDGNGHMGNIISHTLNIKQDHHIAADMTLTGKDFHTEKAIITIEIYKKDVWRFAAVARGFNGGLGDLLRSYGGEETVVPTPAPQPSPRQESVRNENQQQNTARGVVELKKGQKVNLVKKGSSMGEILINLNWDQPQQKKGLFASKAKGIDLDLGCLFELSDGTKGSIQALGKHFGSLNQAPYISLDGDDRTGASAAGENLRINGNMISKIKRVLVYTFIYEGAVNWRGANGVVTVKCPGNQDIIVRMDEYGSNQVMCAIALLENRTGESFAIEKIVRFFNGHRDMDKAFNWGLKWVAGRK